MSAFRSVRLNALRRLFCDSGSLKRLRVLGIETSCDDTGVAIVDSARTILGEARHSQSEIHAIHGGIVPQLAKELHEENIRNTVNEVMEKSKLRVSDVDAIAVTVKPGIPGSLHVGIECAKDLCSLYQKPLIPVHHMEAHALTVRLLENVEFPFLVLLASGGHCILALAESVTKFLVLGESSDISPGVFFDKAARRLNLRNMKEYTAMQGGVAIEAAAKKGNPFEIKLPFTVKYKRDCNFSFSGFQTLFYNYVSATEKNLGIVANDVLPNVHNICAFIQFELFKYICEQLEIGMRYLDTKKMVDSNKRVLVVSGGVASNEYFRKMLKFVCDHYQYGFLVPPKRLCTDNGVMIAWNGIERLLQNTPTVPPDELHTVQLSQRCSLGENISNDLNSYARKGKYLNLRKLMKQMEERSTGLLIKLKSEVSCSQKSEA